MTGASNNNPTRCDNCKQSTPRAIPGYCVREQGHDGNHFRTANLPADPRNTHPLTAMLVARGSL